MCVCVPVREVTSRCQSDPARLSGVCVCVPVREVT